MRDPIMLLSSFTRRHWVKLGLLASLPLALYFGLGARVSWQPRTLHAGQGDEVVTTMAFAPDGKELAVGLSRGEESCKILLWDMPAAALSQTIVTNTHHPMTGLALTSKGSIAGGNPKLSHGFANLELWDANKKYHLLSTQSQHRTLEGCAPFVFAPDGQRLFSLTGQLEGLSIVAWDAQHGTVLHSSRIVPPPGHYLWPYNDSAGANSGPICALSPSGRWGAIQTWIKSPRFSHHVTEDGGLLLFDAPNGHARRLIATGYCRQISFTSDEKQLIIPKFGDNRLQFWDIQTGRLQHQTHLNGHTDGSPLAFSADCTLMATGGYDMWDHRVLLWDTRTGALLRKLPLPSGSINCLAFAPDGATLAAGQNGIVKFWRIK